jgi:hypothetical protein
MRDNWTKIAQYLNKNGKEQLKRETKEMKRGRMTMK